MITEDISFNPELTDALTEIMHEHHGWQRKESANETKE